jgi:hypothetical protein
MTQDSNNIIDVTPAKSFDDRMLALLPSSELEALKAYIKSGGSELALSTANKFFELYINGNDVDDIVKLNPAFSKVMINWSRIKYNWDAMRAEYISKLQSRIMDKVLKAQLEATSLYADVISAANKKHSENLAKYLQTGDEKYLAKTLSINNVAQLQKAVEGLQKVTGQDKNFKIVNEQKTSVDVNISGSLTSGEGVSADSAAKILSILAEEKRSQENKKIKDDK